MNINLHIDRLIIDGIDIGPQQKKELLHALESSLKQQLLAQGAGTAIRSHAHRNSVNGGAINVGTGADPVRLGRMIGKAICKGIDGGIKR